MHIILVIAWSILMVVLMAFDVPYPEALEGIIGAAIGMVICWACVQIVIEIAQEGSST